MLPVVNVIAYKDLWTLEKFHISSLEAYINCAQGCGLGSYSYPTLKIGPAQRQKQNKESLPTTLDLLSKPKF